MLTINHNKFKKLLIFEIIIQFTRADLAKKTVKGKEFNFPYKGILPVITFALHHGVMAACPSSSALGLSFSFFFLTQLDEFTTTYVLRQLQVYTETKIEIYGLTSVGRGIPSQPAYVGKL